MAKKKASSDPLDEVRKAVGTKKFVIGTARTMKALMAGNASKVFITKNCPEALKQDLQVHASAEGIQIEELPVANDELGTICKKMFAISVVSLLKE